MSQSKADVESDLISRLLEAGAHYGYSKTRNHPSTKTFIYGYKNRGAVIDLEQTVAALSLAQDFLAQVMAAGKQVLWVGNKDEAQGVVKQVADSLGLPYVASRWLGGTFTNYGQIKSRIDRLIDLKNKRESGELGVYTKREQGLFDREIDDLERHLGSLAGIAGLPGAVVVVDPAHEKIVVAEARKTGVPVVALANTDCDLRGIAYPIVVNDANTSSLRLVLGELAKACELGLAAREKAIDSDLATSTDSSEAGAKKVQAKI